jgi:hypothetical protein
MALSSPNKQGIFTIQIFSFLTLILIGSYAMSADIELKWEWPANRTIDKKILVKIDSIDIKKSGIFGFFNSPSIIGNLPDPRTLTGKVIKLENNKSDVNFKLTLPLLELNDIKSGSFAALGIVNNTTCICIVPVESIDTNLDDIKCLEQK